MDYPQQHNKKLKLVTGGPDLLPDCSNYDTEAYKKAMNTVDTIIAQLHKGEIKVMLIKRRYEPFKGMWAIPGGFVDLEKEESLDEASIRELKEETGAVGVEVQQLHTYGDPFRDPRGRVFSVAYYALVSADRMSHQKLEAADDADKDAGILWASFRDLDKLELAFDHRKILGDFSKKLKSKVQRDPCVFQLVPELFTWKEVQDAYEAVLERPVNNVRRKVLNRYIVKKEGVREGTHHRPPALFRYISEKDNF